MPDEKPQGNPPNPPVQSETPTPVQSETPAQASDTTVPGGKYIVSGVAVDAEGKPLSEKK